MDVQNLIDKANVLLEALPYIADFKGELIVIKLGGSVQEDETALRQILRDVASLRILGMLPIVVHGGGKAISKALKEKGLGTQFVQGFRVTDDASMDVVEHVIRDEVNAQIVQILKQSGVNAAPLSGERVFFSLKKTAVDSATGETLDWGWVGVPSHCDTGLVRQMLAIKQIPVVCPLGRGPDGHLYNINADTAAAALASALPARKLVFISDVPGLLADPADPTSLITTLRMSEVEGLKQQGVISGGMIPKIESCLDALRAGVRKVHLVDGRMAHSILLEMFTESGVGTQIVKA